MSIELRHLRYFLAVADELHFGRAAERLGMSQPPLSQQIRQLEQRVGAPLFRRSNRRVALTEAGRQFLAEAGAILERVEHAVTLARRAHRGELGELRIGFTRTAPLSLAMPEAIRAFRQHWPQVHMQLQEMNTLQQVEALLERRLDLGIIRDQQLPDTLVSSRLFDDPLVAVMRSDHPLLVNRATPASLPTAALADTPFVAFAPDAGTGILDHILSLCRSAGFTPHIAQDAREATTLVSLVAAGLGVSILPASCARIRVDGVCFIPLQEPAASSAMHAAHLREAASPLITHFIEQLTRRT